MAPFGAIPAFRGTSLKLAESLNHGRHGQHWLQRVQVLIVSQVAFSLVLRVGAGLFVRTLINLANVDIGFNRENLHRLQTDAGSIGYKEGKPRLAALYQQIEERAGPHRRQKISTHRYARFHRRMTLER